MPQHLELPDEELDSPLVSSVGIAEIQGNKILVLTQSRGERVTSVHYVSTAFQSTALEEAKQKLAELTKFIETQ